MAAKAEPMANVGELWGTRCWVDGEEVDWIGLVKGDEA